MLFSKKFRNVADKGIYLGIWRPNDEFGRSLKMEFDLYAGTSNLCSLEGQHLILPNHELLDALSRSNTHTPNPGYISTTKLSVMCSLLKSGTYKGEWFLPTQEVLQYMLSNSQKGDLNNIFISTENVRSDAQTIHPNLYHCLSAANSGEVKACALYRQNESITVTSETLTGEGLTNSLSTHLVRALPRKKRFWHKGSTVELT